MNKTFAVNIPLKIVLIGESGVGKTSVLSNYLGSNEPIKATIGVQPYIQAVDNDGTSIKLRLFDTAGQEKFSGLNSNFYSGADGVIFVYDCTNYESFERLNNWNLEFMNHCKNPNVVKVLLKNKEDKEEHKVTDAEAEEFAAKHEMKHYQASAHTGKGIKECFQGIITDIMKNISQDTDANKDEPHQSFKEVKSSSCCG